MAASLVPQPILDLGADAQGGLAVFDADGVLWHGDVSEDFTLWMISEGHFDGKLWPVYERRNHEDPAAGCIQILNFYTGKTAQEVRTLVERFWQVAPERSWLPRVRAVLKWARSRDMAIFVVSGTPAIVLEPLRRHLDIDRVFGIELEYDTDGRATGKSTGITTVGVGKAERVRAETDMPVQLAAGNSVLDVPMLRMSTGVSWAINPDRTLRSVAEQAGWFISQEPEG